MLRAEDLFTHTNLICVGLLPTFISNAPTAGAGTFDGRLEVDTSEGLVIITKSLAALLQRISLAGRLPSEVVVVGIL